jgi:hypothetical protein
MVMRTPNALKLYVLAHSLLDLLCYWEKTVENYCWALQVIKSVLDRSGDPYPEVVIIDRELALISALRQVFPLSKRLLCEWYVQQNVLSNASKSFAGDEELRDQFLVEWA